MSNLQWPRGLQPTRLLPPWDFPGKSTGVGCHCLLRDGPLTNPWFLPLSPTVTYSRTSQTSPLKTIHQIITLQPNPHMGFQNEIQHCNHGLWGPPRSSCTWLPALPGSHLLTFCPCLLCPGLWPPRCSSDTPSLLPSQDLECSLSPTPCDSLLLIVYVSLPVAPPQRPLDQPPCPPSPKIAPLLFTVSHPS